jgi:hypothetical protein
MERTTTAQVGETARTFAWDDPSILTAAITKTKARARLRPRVSRKNICSPRGLSLEERFDREIMMRMAALGCWGGRP